MIGEILKKLKIKKPEAPTTNKKSKIFIGGNIGQPLIDKLEKIQKKDLVVLELSSFQLEDLAKSPHIAVILNITPDHLNRHYKFSDYIKAKKNIIKFQKKDDWAILNFDDEIVKNFPKDYKGKVFPFSINKKFKKGVQIENGYITVKNGISEQKICSKSRLKLLGGHNLENVLSATAVAYLIGVEPEQIKEVITGFSGLEHRLEFVSEINRVKFYNDSKATTCESTIVALRSFDCGKIILIAGGYDKKADFSKLACEIINSKVKHLILIGETSDKIAQAILQISNLKSQISKCKTLKEAVKLSKKISQSGDIILLSPACASYDMFLNFEERGKKFKQLVKKEK